MQNSGQLYSLSVYHSKPDLRVLISETSWCALCVVLRCALMHEDCLRYLPILAVCNIPFLHKQTEIARGISGVCPQGHYVLFLINGHTSCLSVG